MTPDGCPDGFTNIYADIFLEKYQHSHYSQAQQIIIVLTHVCLLSYKLSSLFVSFV